MDWTKWIELATAIPRGIGKLFWYFQVPGVLSILGWLAALILLVVFYRRPRRRNVPYVVALGLALLGFAFGHLNSTSISRIRTDMTDKLNEARAMQEEASRQLVQERRQQGLLDDIHFAEDDKTDIIERERESDAKKSIYELASEGKSDLVEKRQTELEAGKSSEYEQWLGGRRQESVPPGQVGPAVDPEPGAGVALDEPPQDDETALARFAYRQEGKKERAAGRKARDTVVRKAMTQEEFVGGRVMQTPDVLRAQRFDRINLFFCRNTLWLALLLLLLDYLFRANRTFWTVWPLPLAGRLLDYFYPKEHAVLMEPESPAFLKGYMETATRKGESFLYFGESDPWRAPALLRFRILSLPEICLRLPETAVRLVESAGAHIAHGYRALIAGKRRRAAAAGRAFLVVRAGDELLGMLDAVLRRLGPPVRRGSGCVADRLYASCLALRSAWVTAQARYPLRLAPVAMLLFIGRGSLQAVGRRRNKQDVPAGNTDLFLLGRVDPDRIGQRRWWNQGRFGSVISRVCEGYWRYAVAHPHWQAWLERQAARLRRLDAILFREGIWCGVPRLRYDRDSLPADRLLPFEAVWFNRYCCCIVGKEAAQAVVPDLLDFLKCRLAPRAQAWQTVNIIWDLALPLEREVLDELAFRCRESNLRLMVVSHGGWAQAMADLFDARATEQIGPDDRARIEYMAVLADRIAKQRGWAT